MSTESQGRLSWGEWLRQPQTLVGLSALLLSLCGLGISLYEASLVRRAQRASVWPFVQVAVSFADGKVDFWVQNTGVGPARVEAASVSYRGKTEPGWSELFRDVAGKTPDGQVHSYSSLLNGRVLPSRSSKEMIFVASTEGGAGLDGPLDRLRKAVLQGAADVVVCYCSVYDECWRADLQDVVGRSRPNARPAGAHRAEDCAAAPRSAI